MSLIGSVIRMFVEYRGARSSFADITKRLQQSQQAVSDRIINAAENHNNHGIGRHIVGMERWGAHRLRSILGEPLVLDEMDGYVLKNSHGGGYIAQDFDHARRELLALVQTLAALPEIEKLKVQHNEFGPLSVKAWLIYLEMHADFESKKLR